MENKDFIYRDIQTKNFLFIEEMIEHLLQPYLFDSFDKAKFWETILRYELTNYIVKQPAVSHELIYHIMSAFIDYFRESKVVDMLHGDADPVLFEVKDQNGKVQFSTYLSSMDIYLFDNFNEDVLLRELRVNTFIEHTHLHFNDELLRYSITCREEDRPDQILKMMDWVCNNFYFLSDSDLLSLKRELFNQYSKRGPLFFPEDRQLDSKYQIKLSTRMITIPIRNSSFNINN